MSTLCAINLSATEAALVTADISPGEPIRILSNRRVNLVDLQLRASPEQQSDSLSDTAAESNSNELSNQTEAQSNEAGYGLHDGTVNQTTHGVRLEIDETTEEILGVIESRETVYSFLELPFQDPKKIEQVATFQIQDGLPFDLENFVVDSFVVGEMSGGNFRVVSSLAPKNVIEKSLATCAHIGIDPRFLTTGAAALITLAQLKYPDRKGLYAYVEFTAQRISVALLLDSIPVHLRDFYPAEGAKIEKGSPNYNSILHHLGCSVSKCEKDSGQSLAEIVVLGASEHRNALSLAIPYRVELFELKDLVVNSAAEELRIEDCSWALGLFAEQLTAKKKRFTRVLPDFRQGPYAYRRTWQAFVSAVKDEVLYLGLAVTLGVGFIGAKISHEYQMMGQLDERFKATLAEHLPGEYIPPRQEISTLTSKTEELEEQLQGLGSLSSLSPLESLKELATALGSGIDVSLDSFNISTKRILLRGTVGENRAVAEVSAALKSRADKFCEVSVDNKGKTVSNRVGFSAELKLCE